ncbi:MAG: hypothetical protein WAL98_07465, partial [Desulfatiglandaceae bacterium]
LKREYKRAKKYSAVFDTGQQKQKAEKMPPTQPAGDKLSRFGRTLFNTLFLCDYEQEKLQQAAPGSQGNL